MGENYKAFDYLGNSLTHDPKNPKTILAVGSVIQDHSDMDVALVKYRVAAVQVRLPPPGCSLLPAGTSVPHGKAVMPNLPRLYD